MKRCVPLLVALCVVGCKQKQAEVPPITSQWTDDFERDELGENWKSTASAYQLVNGALSAKGAHNRPLWLRRSLPRDVAVELDCWSNSAAGDIKVELFGDGASFDPDKGAYKSTAYVIIMGGWNNSKSMIARQDEHGKDVVERTSPKVETGKRYHFKIVRKGSVVDWYVDDMDTPFLSFDDPAPLEGPGHQFFAIGNWESDAWYDNLSITPL